MLSSWLIWYYWQFLHANRSSDTRRYCNCYSINLKEALIITVAISKTENIWDCVRLSEDRSTLWKCQRVQEDRNFKLYFLSDINNWSTFDLQWFYANALYKNKSCIYCLNIWIENIITNDIILKKKTVRIFLEDYAFKLCSLRN